MSLSLYHGLYYYSRYLRLDYELDYGLIPQLKASILIGQSQDHIRVQRKINSMSFHYEFLLNYDTFHSPCSCPLRKQKEKDTQTEMM